MHHKHGRARRRRAGCKLCKPWKMNGHRTERRQVAAAAIAGALR